MQKSVVLKGYKDGYEIELKADAAFSQILIELTELFERLKHEKEKNDEKIAFNIKTGARLLTIDQKHEIEKIVDNYPNFFST